MPSKHGGLLIGVGLCAGAWVACSVDERSPDTVRDTDAEAGTAPGGSASGALPQSNAPAAQAPAQNNGTAPSSFECPGASASCAAAPTTVSGGCMEGKRRCVAGAPELCSGGVWVPGTACGEPLPFCLESSGQCASCEPGAKRCTGTRVEGCGDDGSWQDLGMPCSECVPGDAGCVGDTARVCSALGAWVGQTCANTLPLCVAATGTCACQEGSCGARELCAASGRCEPLGPDCPPIAPVLANEQDVAIVRVRFDPDGSADVLMQNAGASLISYAAQSRQLCNGRSNCVYLGETQSVLLPLNASFSLRIPNTLPSGGELAIVLNQPDLPFACDAYVAWGSGAAGSSFESLVNNDLRLWNTGERIAIEDGDTGFVSTGDTTSASGYSSCNPGNE